MRKLIVRWALKQIKKNVHRAMDYEELASWGIADIMLTGQDEKAYIL